MRRTICVSLLVFGAVSLASCSSEPADDSAVTETKMDAVDSVQGTISDEMIVTDDSSEQALIADASEAPAEPVKGATANSDKKPSEKPQPIAAKPAPPKPAPQEPAEESSAE